MAKEKKDAKPVEDKTLRATVIDAKSLSGLTIHAVKAKEGGFRMQPGGNTLTAPPKFVYLVNAQFEFQETKLVEDGELWIYKK